MIIRIVEHYGILRTSIVAAYETCGILPRILMRSPYRVARFHMLYNPIFEELIACRTEEQLKAEERKILLAFRAPRIPTFGSSLISGSRIYLFTKGRV